jgi:hypothetical protein
LRHLRSLRYEGAADRRQRGLDMVPVLQQLTAAAADGAGDARRPVLLPGTAAATAEAPAGDDGAEQPTQEAPEVRHEQLEVLELRAGQLPDALLDVVGAAAG